VGLTWAYLEWLLGRVAKQQYLAICCIQPIYYLCLKIECTLWIGLYPVISDNGVRSILHGGSTAGYSGIHGLILHLEPAATLMSAPAFRRASTFPSDWISD
jgi:hypothetical protein